jgi:GT2 family glycosyltransferase
MGSPTVAIAICTRNRPEDLVKAVASALRNHGASEIVIVDQSSSSASRDALQSSGAFRDQRLVYVPTPDAVGLSRSRNVAISSTTAQLVAFTDDDCEVPPDWASGVATQFSRDPELGMSFGAVLVPPELEEAGFTPSFRPTRPGPVVLADDPVMIFGLGANMIIRRSTLERVGAFDELLGAGAPLFKAGEDTDYALRALKRGFKVATTLDT